MSDANGRCRACLTPVIWARTERTRWLALNPKPDPAGNQAAWRDSDGTWRTRQLSEKAEPRWGFEQVFMPHIATCEKQRPKPEPAPSSPERHPDQPRSLKARSSALNQEVRPPWQAGTAGARA